jgi:glycosyltransferase involved in cell wall biosynthesis
MREEQSKMETKQTDGLRVCMLMESFYPVVGGMESQARNMIRSLTAIGISVIVVTRRTEADWPTQDHVYGVPVYRVLPAGPVSHARWILAMTCLPTLFRLRNQYDIILVPGLRTLGIPAVIAGRLLGKLSILKGASSGEFSGEFFSAGLGQHGLKGGSAVVRMMIRLRNALFSKATAIISLSTEMTAEFKGAGAPSKLIHQVPNTLDDEAFRPASGDEKLELRKKLEIPPEATVVAFSGRMVSYKGVPRLIRVWERLCETHDNIRLLLVGSGGSDIHNCDAEVQEFIRSHHMQDRILLTGFVDNVDDYLRASDIFAFPTENEAFPLALLEAMACGLPVVATRVGGIPDAIEHEQNGLMIDPAQEDQLQAALERLIGDEALRQQLSEASLRTVRERYLPATVAQRYKELFEDCTRQKQAKSKRKDG